MKKVSAISPLAVIIMVIVLGASVVSVAEGQIDISEPKDGFVYINGTISNTSITEVTLILNEEVISDFPVKNGNFSIKQEQVKLKEGNNNFTIATGEGIKTKFWEYHLTPPTTTEEDGAAIPYWPWIIVGAIVVVSFLIFFVIVERAEEELLRYTFIIWIASAIIIPIVLFFALSLFGKIGFEPIHMIVAIIAAILLPLSISLLYDTIKEGKKERAEPSRKKSDFLSAPSYSTINFKVFDEKTEQPISGAKVSVMKSDSLTAGYKGPTNQAGIYECDLKSGTYRYEIDPVGGYKPKSGKFSVEGSGGVISISLSKRTGNLTVQVKDIETENPVQGANVSVSGVEKRTDEHGKALFPGVTIGEKEIKIDEISGVYSSETEKCEIREDTPNEVTVSIKSLLRIPIDKESKLNALRNQLQDNYRRVSTYDPCIPFYYKSVVDNMVNLVKGMAGKPMLFVYSKNNPGEIIGHLIDAVDLASREIIGVMASKRNVDVYSAAMELEKAEVRATPVDFDDSRVVDYIRDAENFYNSHYHTAQGKLFEIDTDITRKTGEMNVLPVSGLWRVARTLLNETSASSAETDSVKRSAMLLVADILLDYVDGMLKDSKIIERLKIMVI